MAVLLIELHGTRRGSVLPRRVLIGRRPMNHLVIDHPAVSRMHAWIDGEGNRYYISDTGSRTGTRVNGQRIVARHLLGDEDEITIGPAKLIFLAEPRVRPGVEEFDLSTSAAPAGDQGILFDCPSCSAPLWAGNDYAGRGGQCKYCGRGLTVPHRHHAGHVHGRVPDAAAHRELSRMAFASAPTAPASAGPASAAAAAIAMPRASALAIAPICGACQSVIASYEDKATCPSCGLVFHAECWEENFGCSAYGCSQVNALQPPEPVAMGRAGAASPGGTGGNGALVAAKRDETGVPASADGLPGAPNRFPWEFLLLAGSVFAALLGALTFGLPSLALAGGSVAYIARTRGSAGAAGARLGVLGGPHRGIVLLSTGLAVLGMFTGAALSYFIYFGSSHS